VTWQVGSAINTATVGMETKHMIRKTKSKSEHDYVIKITYPCSLLYRQPVTNMICGCAVVAHGINVHFKNEKMKKFQHV